MVQVITLNFLDSYEWKARVAPSALILFPIIIAVFSFNTAYLKVFFDYPLIIPLGILIFIFLAYCFSFFIRYFGKVYEKKLWKSWGGPPSTRFIRWKDSTYSFEQKAQIHNLIFDKFGIKLKGLEEETANQEAADIKIQQAFSQVISFLYRNDKKGIWKTSNEEYGFLRNILGNRILFSIFSASSTILSYHFMKENFDLINISLFVIAALFFLFALISCWWIFPRLIKEVADRYANSVWMIFLNYFT